MGNSSAKFDILSHLPPELVLAIISCLHLKDVTKCLLVCRQWNKVISNLGSYWRSEAGRVIGLSKNAINRCSHSFSTPRDFYVAAVKHKSVVKSIKFKCSQIELSTLSTDEPSVFTHCLFARDGMLVQTQKISVANHNQKYQCSLSLEKVESTCRNSQSVCSLPLDPNDCAIAWAYASKNFLFWVTRNGTWNGYDLRTDTELFHWRGHLLKDGQGVGIGCCEKCLLVVATHWYPTSSNQSTHNSTFSMQIAKLCVGDSDNGEEDPGVKNVLPWEIFRMNHKHSCFVNHDSRYWIRELLVLPNSENKGEEGICQSHGIILQCDCCTVTQSFTMPGKQLTKPTCLNCQYSLNCDQENDTTEVSTRRLSSKVCLSSDKQLLGMVFDNKLHVWKCRDNQESMHTELLSVAALTRKQTSACNEVKLAALGHIFSIVGYLDDMHLMDYKLHIVSTQTGETLSQYRRVEKFYDWSFCCRVDPLHKFYFVCDQENDDWLNDIQCNVPDAPIMTLHNHYGRINVEAVALSKTAKQGWRKYWRCALNPIFRRN